MQRTAKEYPWLREFAPTIIRPDVGAESIVWDWLPEDWTKEDRFYDRDAWCGTEVLQAGKVEQEYNWVVQGLDELLKEHGYEREERYYRVHNANNDTIVLFCHFGVECVMLSHLLGISPMVLWHGTCAAPTSVTTLVTEERREGIASFRMTAFGDTSHLYVHREEPAFAARFCECYDNKEERHD